MILFLPSVKKWIITACDMFSSELAVICVKCYKIRIKTLVEGDALTSVMLLIGVRTTELLWKLFNLVNSYPCSEKDMLDGISTGFYLQKVQSSDILRNFLVVLGQFCNHSLHLREVDLCSVMCFLRVFTLF